MPFLPCARRRLPGQNSKASLQSRKTALQKEMSRLNEAIARNDKNQKSNTVQLQSLRNRTRVREEMIKNINTDIGMLDVQIDSKSGKRAFVERIGHPQGLIFQNVRQLLP